MNQIQTVGGFNHSTNRKSPIVALHNSGVMKLVDKLSAPLRYATARAVFEALPDCREFLGDKGDPAASPSIIEIVDFLTTNPDGSKVSALRRDVLALGLVEAGGDVSAVINAFQVAKGA